MPSTLSAHEKQISQIFSREFVFNIPGYQRPYSWTKDQAGELFDDLITFMRDRPQSAVSEMPPYFLGSIVLIKSDTSPDADVVDGQQRLTTITILLSVLRANIQSEEGEAITNLIYEKGQTILGTQDHFRLTLRPRDKEFFKKYVQRSKELTNLLSLEQDISDTQTRIRDNARLFQDRISSLKDAERIRLAEFIVTRCFLVVVSTPDLDSAYRIFSVMNSRGLDLSATDILKAEIIGKIPEDERPDYTQKWEEIEEDLGRDSFVDLFSQIRMVYRKAKSQGTLLKEFQEHVSSAHTPKDLIDDVIAPMARVYAELVDEAYTSTEFAEEINQHLRWLNRFEFSDWMPPAIAFSMRNRHVPKRMKAFFRDLERLAFWILLTRAGVNERIDRFSRLTRDIESGVDLYVEKSSLQLTLKERTDTKTVLNGPIYDLLPARARSIVMLRLDSLVSGGGATYDYPTVTVEHVLPQNPLPNSLWITWFPDQNQRSHLTHRLGNLALLTRKKNSSASNFEFDRKKKAYFSNNGVSPFPITTQVLQHTDWTPKIVEDRQNELVAILDTHWRLSEAQT